MARRDPLLPNAGIVARREYFVIGKRSIRHSRNLQAEIHTHALDARRKLAGITRRSNCWVAGLSLP